MFPRVKTIEGLLHVIKNQPKLTKDASSTLIDLGQAMQSTAKRDEIAVVLRGTLQQEAHVRNSCLQCLQVRRSRLLTRCFQSNITGSRST